MKIALVHDYIKEFGGAERVLRVLADMYPTAPIYTAFVMPGSVAARLFSDRKIIESPFSLLLRYGNLHSPLRFLLPWVWGSLDLSSFDLVITSCSGYIARGFRVSAKTRVVAYCHTPPKYLYGLQKSISWMGFNWADFWPAKIFATVVNHFLRQFDFLSAQRVDKWIVNSNNVARRVMKFYRKDSEVIYPPIETGLLERASKGVEKEDYFLIVSRLVGGKGLLEAVEAAKRVGIKIKIAGESAGSAAIGEKLKSLSSPAVELLGRVDDAQLWGLYASAKGFIALASEEDFGMTVVEAAAAGTSVIALDSGGFRETVVDGETGILIDATDVATLEKAFKRFNEMKWDKEKLQIQARKFSREKFEEKIRKVVAGYAGTTGS
ncbi:MAG TPA: glycosyltransferase [Patescibacteria group bacterium]|nr:glycosyltransferase [Patescibacteria group bacterium]